MRLPRHQSSTVHLTFSYFIILMVLIYLYGNAKKESRKVTSWSSLRPGNQTSASSHADAYSFKDDSRTTSNLSSFIDEQKDEIIADVQEFLQFAVIGHAKTGTTFLLRQWLGKHPQILMPQRETHHALENYPKKGAITLIKVMASLNDTHLDPKAVVHRGIKNPALVHELVGLGNLQIYFPRTKLIVGLRHPVWWFQSFYNFLSRQPRFESMPSPHALVGPCRVNRNFCTHLAQFHYNLGLMGKTPLTSPGELQWFGERLPPIDLLHMENPLFLYETSQLHTAPPQEQKALATDLQDFLELELPLQSLGDFGPQGHQAPPVLDICKVEYSDIRKVLVENGRNASNWIRTYLLRRDDVYVSSPTSFARYLRRWERDPCMQDESRRKVVVI